MNPINKNILNSHPFSSALYLIALTKKILTHSIHCHLPSALSLLPALTEMILSHIHCHLPSARSLLPALTERILSHIHCHLPSALALLPTLTKRILSHIHCHLPSALLLLPVLTKRILSHSIHRKPLLCTATEKVKTMHNANHTEHTEAQASLSKALHLKCPLKLKCTLRTLKEKQGRGGRLSVYIHVCVSV